MLPKRDLSFLTDFSGHYLPTLVQKLKCDALADGGAVQTEAVLVSTEAANTAFALDGGNPNLISEAARELVVIYATPNATGHHRWTHISPKQKDALKRGELTELEVNSHGQVRRYTGYHAWDDSKTWDGSGADIELLYL